MRNWILRNRPFLFFVPVLIVTAAWALARNLHDLFRLLPYVCAGLFAWTLIEWMLHRAMHVETGIGWISRFQSHAHMRHHREPDDLEHAVMRLSGSVPLAAVFLGMIRLILGEWPASVAMWWGLVIGYLAYEAVHLAAHGGGRVPGLAALRAYHLRHHFEQSDRCFGVTSPLWDLVFRTLPRRRPTSRNVSGAPTA